MKRYFTISDCTVVRYRSFNNGFTILVREKPLNNLSKPEFSWLAIWGPKAQAIATKLHNGARFRFSGNVTESRKNGKTYQNNTVELWKALPKEETKSFKPHEEPDHDWFVPEIRNRDRRSDRLSECFSG